MKKILFLLVILALAACSGDNDNSPAAAVPNYTGTLTVNGVSKPVNKGYIIMPYTGSDPSYDKRRCYIILTDGTVSLDENSDFVYGNDIHAFIDFGLYSAEGNQGTIQNATYGLYIPGTGFDMSNPFLDHSGIVTNVTNQDGEITGDMLDSDDMDSGQLSLTQANGLYVLSFNFANPDNTVSGSFTGFLTALPYEY